MWGYYKRTPRTGSLEAQLIMRDNGVVHDVTITTPLWADLTAVAVGSLQGALFAAGFKRLDLLGVAIVGIASGIGGGFLRDILLNTTPAAFSNNWYLLAAVLAAFVGMLVPRLFHKVDPVVTLLDALSIGMFGAIGATKALSLGLPMLPSLFIGTISAVGGGVLRDVILNIPIALMHVGSFYAVATMAGITVMLGLMRFGVDVFPAAITCVAVTTLLRLLAVRFGWSLPEQRALSKIQLRRQRQVEAVIEEALQTGAIILPDLQAELDDIEELDEEDLATETGTVWAEQQRETEQQQREAEQQRGADQYPKNPGAKQPPGAHHHPHAYPHRPFSEPSAPTPPSDAPKPPPRDDGPRWIGDMPSAR